MEIQIYTLFKEIITLNYKKGYTKLEKIGLRPGQPILLEIVNREEGITISELSKKSRKEKATITKMVQRLEKDKYLIRKTSLEDKRLVRLFLTDSGKMKSKEVENFLEEEVQMTLKSISSEEKEVLINIFKKIKHNLEM